MAERINGFSEDAVKDRLADLVDKTQRETTRIGIQTLVVGSMGIAGLTGIYPRLFR